jgi:hypothetical protein
MNISDLNVDEIRRKLSNLEFDDVFPLNNKACTMENMLKAVGLYLVAQILATMLLILLGHIFILGIIVKIICIPVLVYCAVGLVAWLLRYMKLN